MIEKAKRLSFLITFMPIVFLTGVSIYLFLFDFNKYLINNRAEKNINQLVKLELVEDSIIKEISCIVERLKTNNIEECRKVREKTDQLISKINTKQSGKSSLILNVGSIFIKNKDKTLNLENYLNSNALIKTLKNIRYDMDTLDNIPLEKLLFDDYYNKILTPLKELVESIVSENIQQESSFYKKLNNIYYYSNLEKILVSYYLTQKISISEEILKKWDNYISQSSFLLELLHQYNKESNMIQKFENTDLENIEEIRIDIIANYQTGEYETSRVDWIDLINHKELIFKEMKNKITLTHLKEFKKISTDLEENLMLYLSLILLSFLSLIFVFKHYSNLSEEDNILEKVVSGIEELSLMSDGTNAEIPNIPHNLSNKKEVYIYLESILQLLYTKEREAQEANKAKSQFLANMSHEIRTPLNGILGFVEILKSTNLTEDQKEFISIIETSSDNLLGIINDILDISKIAADKMTLESISFDLGEKVNSVIEILSAKAEQKDIFLSIYIDPEIHSQRKGDPTKIAQILTNLVGNAIKFTPTYGDIDVCVEKDITGDNPNNLIFKVIDSGIGISPENQVKIFEAFSQADNSTTREFGGTGLGLAISSEMVALMGAKLELSSKEGKGSIFYFTLDLEKDLTIENKIYIELNTLKVGLALPIKNLYRQIDKARVKYLEYLKVDVEIYYYEEIFNSKEMITFPDLMIFDHQYARKKGELEEISNLKECSSIVVTNGTLKGRIDFEIHRFKYILHSPITLNKIDKMLRTITEKGNISDQETTVKHILEDTTFEGMHVLVAEDNKINQRLIKMTLEKLNMIVDIAQNGKEAFEMRKENNNYKIIFMDIQMPIMTGIESTHTILEYEREKNIKHIPIVALTANALVGDKEKYLEAGMDNYLSKPISLEKLKEMISDYFYEEKNLVEDKENDIEQNTVLFYSNLYFIREKCTKTLVNLGYEVDVLKSRNEFLDKMYEKKYEYIIYEAERFDNEKLLMYDLILDRKAKPFALIFKEDAKYYKNKNVLFFNTTLLEIKNIFNKDQKGK